MVQRISFKDKHKHSKGISTVGQKDITSVLFLARSKTLATKNIHKKGGVRNFTSIFNHQAERKRFSTPKLGELGMAICEPRPTVRSEIDTYSYDGISWYTTHRSRARSWPTEVGLEARNSTDNIPATLVVKLSKTRRVSTLVLNPTLLDKGNFSSSFCFGSGHRPDFCFM